MPIIRTFGYDPDLEYAPLDSMPDDELLHFCLQNKQIPIERDENHQLIFLPIPPIEYSIKKLD